VAVSDYRFVSFTLCSPSAWRWVSDPIWGSTGSPPRSSVTGGVGGARAVEQLRLICIELQMAPTRTAVHIGMETYLGVTQKGKELSDFDFLNRRAEATLDEFSWWTHMLKPGRVGKAKVMIERGG
jgi:NAD(P)H-dependent FMN reductase